MPDGIVARILTAMPSHGPDLKSTELARAPFGLSTLGRTNAAIAGAAIFALLLPVLLILFNVSYVTNSEWLYDYGWWRNDIANRTGLSVEELNSGADQIKEYFGNDAEFLDLRVNFGGTEVSLYKEREILHMVDVKALMQGVFSITRWSGIALLVLLVAGAFTLKRDAAPLLLRSLRWSAIGTGVFLVVFGITAAINFGWLFTQFHFLSFANDLWLLDPSSDYLIIMFPQRFFFEAAMFIGLLTIIDFAILYGAARYVHKRLW